MNDKPMIIVIDDEPAIRALANKVLEAAGYRVRDFGSGKDAIAFYQEQPQGVDLALIDVVMPGLSGPQTLQHMRQLNPDIQAVAISGFLGAIDQEQIENEFLDFLPKPFHIDSLLDIVSRYAPQE